MNTLVKNAFLFVFACMTPLFAKAQSDSDSSTCSTQITMNWSYENTTKVVKLSFSEKEVRETAPGQWEYLSSHTEYPFEEDFPLPEDLWKKMGAPQAIIIKTGRYPISCTNGNIEITISL